MDNKTMDVRFFERTRYGQYEAGTTKKFALNSRAEIAKELAQRWGIVAFAEDGEDSTGRQKIRRLTPNELVQRACDTADLLISEFDQRNWRLELPEPKSDTDPNAT